MDPDTRPEPPHAAGPEEMVGAFLDFHRATLLWKLSGLDDAALRRSMVPSGTCLLGIVKHQIDVEKYWFQEVFAGQDATYAWSREDPDADWRIEPTDTTAGILEAYAAQMAVSRAVVAGRRWDEPAARPSRRGEQFTLGWILSHMLEEVARHNGHADLLREHIDGATDE